MNTASAPTRENFILACADVQVIAHALKYAIAPKTHFTHAKPIPGLPFSARIIAPAPFSDAAPLPGPRTPQDVAFNLQLLAYTEARFEPRPNPEAKKGWAIHKDVIEGVPVAIVYARWI